MHAGAVCLMTLSMCRWKGSRHLPGRSSFEVPPHCMSFSRGLRGSLCAAGKPDPLLERPQERKRKPKQKQQQQPQYEWQRMAAESGYEGYEGYGGYGGNDGYDVGYSGYGDIGRSEDYGEGAVAQAEARIRKQKVDLKATRMASPRLYGWLS